MLNATAGRPLATTITGSIPRPAWFDQNLGGRTFRNAMGDARYREQYQDAVSSHIRDQERAGLDIVTDGDCRFDADVGGQSWFLYPARRLDGLAGDDYPAIGYGSGRGTIIFEAMEARIMPRVTGPVARGRLQYPDVFKFAQELTARPVKFGTITPEVLGMSLANDHYPSYADLVMAMSDAFHEELLDVAAAGCRVIQLEEPNVHLASVRRRAGVEELDVPFFTEVFNNTVRGLRERTEVWCHSCWGNTAQQRLFAEPRSYGPALEALNSLDADVITFECASTAGMDLELIAAAVSSDKKVAIGVVDHRNLHVESPEQIAALIRRALEHIEPERLAVSSDCGFGREGMTRRIAFYKMVAIVRGTNIVRRELGLEEAECRAADPAFALGG
ncbi:MAG TPA: cobalamin-independent methionine synthase II family protein [Solirubrobacteraceae bacterium]|jgi:5-methyltetrahydropteroyltriglutamate--homocysteine methyltransferase|nr:cobalamin-independent methionine synthase II family protein [Solirubrobacteraceae bacterium]